MADRVQYVLDRMAKVLRKVEDLSIFSSDEVKSIVKQRTTKEYILMRRQLEVDDFQSYIDYEMKLDALLSLRCTRLISHASIKKEDRDVYINLQAAFIRHICYIYDRGVRRFPDSVELWNNYFTFLKDKKSNKILNSVYGKALALFPKNEEFWLEAAMHELNENNNAHAARILLQRAIRSNSKSRSLFKKYFELELWCVLRSIERQKILSRENRKEIVQIEENQSPVEDKFAVLLVVFKHATLAVPDLSFACSLHRSCSEVADDLGDYILQQIKASHSGDPELWLHLLSIERRRAESSIRSLDASSASIVSAIAVSIQSLATFVEIANQGIPAFSSSSPSSPSTAVLLRHDSVFALMTAVQDIVWHVISVIGSCVSSFADLSVKDEDMQQLEIALAAVESAFDKLIFTMSNDDDTLVSSAASISISEAFNLFRVSIGLKIPVSLGDSFLNWLNKNIVKLRAVIERNGVSGSLKSIEIDSITAWATVAGRALSLASHQVVFPLLNSFSKKGVASTVNELLRCTASNIGDAAKYLTVNDSCKAVLKQGIDFLLTFGDGDRALSCLRAAVSSQYCSSDERGIWANRYLSLTVSLKGRQAVGHVVVELHTLFTSNPHLAANCNLDLFYNTASQICVNTIRKNKKRALNSDSSCLTTAKDVLMYAVDAAQSPHYMKSFLGLAAEVERLRDNHEAANTLLWKKSKIQ